MKVAQMAAASTKGAKAPTSPKRPSGANKGGRPRKTQVVASNSFEAFKLQIWKLNSRRKVNFFSADLGLMTKITEATHGNRGVLVRQLARKKGVHESTIWHYVREVEQAVLSHREGIKELDALNKSFSQQTDLSNEFLRVEEELDHEVNRNVKARAGARRLDFPAKKFALNQLRSTDFSVSRHAEIIDALERIGNDKT
jgi:hypothetical protein